MTIKKNRTIEHNAYFIKNKDKINTQRRKNRIVNIEKIRLQGKIWREKNIDKVKYWIRKYYLANQEKQKTRSKLWRAANPEKIRVQNRKYKALKLGNNHESYTDTYIFERDNWVCGICGQKINKRLKYPNPRSKSIDHILSISKGGADAPINLQAAHLRCNMNKKAQSGGQLRLIG